MSVSGLPGPPQGNYPPGYGQSMNTLPGSPQGQSSSLASLADSVAIEKREISIGDLQVAAQAATIAITELGRVNIPPDVRRKIQLAITNPDQYNLPATLAFCAAMKAPESVMGSTMYPSQAAGDATRSIAAQQPPAQYQIPQALPQPVAQGNPQAVPVGQGFVTQSPTGMYNSSLGPPMSSSLSTPVRAF